MDAPRQYFEELRDELSLYPTWLPGDPIELGSFGTITRGRFSKRGRLTDLGIQAKTKEKRPEDKTDYKLSRGIKFTANAVSNAVGGTIDATAGIKLHFERAYAWAFGARGTSVAELENIFEIESCIRELFKEGKWERPWLLISEIRTVDNLNVLVARKRNVEGSIIGKGTITQPLDLLLSEEASFNFSNEDTFTVSNAKDKSPLYGLRKLTWLGDFSEVSGGDVPGGSEGEEVPSLKPARRVEFGS